MSGRKVIVIGAGVGGMAAALIAAARGCETLVLERAAAPGGKLSAYEVAGRRIDAGPTVLTMRDVFDNLVAEVGARLEDLISLKPARVLARHAWSETARLDLTGDVEENADAIAAFAGAQDARGYRAFAARGADMLATLDESFMRASRPNPLSLAARVAKGKGRILSISPFETLWDALGQHFRDPRLKQMFGRYATYCGSSPYLAPATLMLIAEVERRGVWYVEGGMAKLAEALRTAAERAGARFLFGCDVERILVERGRARGVAAGGQRYAADAIVFNGDASALGAGLLGEDVRAAATPTKPAERSLSALTLIGVGRARGFPLVRHNVFFGADYPQEFDAIFNRGRAPAEPTTYVCAADREDAPGERGEESLYLLVNAPARDTLTAQELQTCETSAMRLLQRCGLTLEWRETRRTAPADFATRFPGTGGALYGPASHGWATSFRRPGARSKIPGLYLAGGSVHPGPGVPMAALSGRQAALALMADLGSTRPFVPAAITGTMSTPSATTAASA